MDSTLRSTSSSDERKELALPLGYRFEPTDVELLEYYLVPKLKGEKLPSGYVMDLDIYPCEPHQLPLNKLKYAKENQVHFFTDMDFRENSAETSKVRTTINGSWRVDEDNVPICNANNETIGLKTKLFFHDSNGNRTDWKMTEYRCHPTRIPIATSTNMKRYIVCKVKQKMKMEEDSLEEEENGTNGGNRRPAIM